MSDFKTKKCKSVQNLSAAYLKPFFKLASVVTKLRCERRWSHPRSITAKKCFNELLTFIFRVMRDITAHQTLNKGSELHLHIAGSANIHLIHVI